MSDSIDLNTHAKNLRVELEEFDQDVQDPSWVVGINVSPPSGKMYNVSVVLPDALAHMPDTEMTDMRTIDAALDEVVRNMKHILRGGYPRG